MIFKSDGATMSAEVLRILGVKPSRPVALVISNDLVVVIRSGSFIKGIQNLTSSGTLVFIRSQVVLFVGYSDFSFSLIEKK